MSQDWEKLLRPLHKKPLADKESLAVACDYGRGAIEMILPHRDPFMFVDRILGIDLANEHIVGSRTVSVNDPVFKGHFPEFALYPGVLQLETVGQLGLCLHYFLANQTTAIPATAQPPQIRVTKVLGAHFLEPVLPGQTMTLISKRLEEGPFLERYVGQVSVGQTVCSVCVGEICKV